MAKTAKYVSNGYKLEVVGEIPTGRSACVMYDHIKSMGVSEGTFKMQVTKDDWYGVISTITFKQIKK
jgi:hypothetical protein